MMSPVKLQFNGFNNITDSYAKPDGKLAEAVNVQFDNAGNIRFPRQGKTLRYSGTDIHSVFKAELITLFVENGALKELHDDNTTTTLLHGLNANPVSYCVSGDSVFWTNGATSGRIVGGINHELGCARPPRQPDANPIAYGGMYAGDYRVAITWIGFEESGTGMGRRITVADGGGIELSNFPVPPAYVKKVAVYVSSVNSKNFYLFGEYPANIAYVVIDKKTLSVPLQTQFGFPPAPQRKIYAHYGRLYYPRGSRLYRTATRRMGLQFANSFWRFDSDIQIVITVPNMIYVGTKNKIYRVTNIDGDGGANVEAVKNYGAIPGTECYDQKAGTAYFNGKRGFIRVNPPNAQVEPLEEITFNDVAMPYFNEGTMSVTEYDGLRYLVGVCKGGKANKFAVSDTN